MTSEGFAVGTDPLALPPPPPPPEVSPPLFEPRANSFRATDGEGRGLVFGDAEADADVAVVVALLLLLRA